MVSLHRSGRTDGAREMEATTDAGRADQPRAAAWGLHPMRRLYCQQLVIVLRVATG